jgi:PAS domain S-box-containing protein
MSSASLRYRLACKKPLHHLHTIPGLVWLAGVDGAAEYLNSRWLEFSGLSQTQAIGWGWTVAIHPEDLDQLAFAGKQKRGSAGSTAFVWSASTDGRLTYVNQRLFDYISAPMEVLRGEGWLKFVHPDDQPWAIARWLQAVATGGPLENQFRLRRADGAYRWFHVPSQLGRTTNGRPTLWYGLLIDIDDRKSVEEALRLTQIKLSRATQIATVGEIAASIAHEINQPLAAIATNGEAGLRFLNREVPDLNEARDALSSMISDSRRAGEVIQRIRALFKGGFWKQWR